MIPEVTITAITSFISGLACGVIVMYFYSRKGELKKQGGYYRNE